MTCQAIIACFRLRVAIHAPFHRHLHPRPGGGAFTFSNISVADFTLQLSHHRVTVMGEEDVIGFAIKVFPGNFLLLLLELPNFFLFRALCNRVFMAFKTGFDLRHSGEGLGLVIAVTGVASQSLLHVFLVIESDGLSGL